MLMEDAEGKYVELYLTTGARICGKLLGTMGTDTSHNQQVWYLREALASFNYSLGGRDDFANHYSDWMERDDKEFKKKLRTYKIASEHIVAMSVLDSKSE